MQRDQLYYFKAVAETNNMTQAAKELFVTPAAISIAISKLENELGVQLFDRTSISVTLNDAGKIYYEAVSAALQYLESAEKVLRGGDTCLSNKPPRGEDIPNGAQCLTID